MTSFVDIPTGKTPAAAADIQQVIDALKGTLGKGIPISLSAVSDAISFALAVRNTEASNSRAAIFYKADGSVLLQIDKSGVQASSDGSAAASAVMTVASAQIVTGSKTFTGAIAVPAGTSYPSSPVAGSIFYRSDMQRLDTFNGTGWVPAAARGAFMDPLQLVHL